MPTCQCSAGNWKSLFKNTALSKDKVQAGLWQLPRPLSTQGVGGGTGALPHTESRYLRGHVNNARAEKLGWFISTVGWGWDTGIPCLYLQSFLKVEQNCKESFRSVRDRVCAEMHMSRAALLSTKKTTGRWARMSRQAYTATSSAVSSHSKMMVTPPSNSRNWWQSSLRLCFDRHLRRGF